MMINDQFSQNTPLVDSRVPGLQGHETGIIKDSAHPHPTPGSTPLGKDFGTVLNDAMHSVDALQRNASVAQERIETGQSDDLVGAMLASQEASLSFSMLLQVRNKVMAAFDDVIRMQV